MVSREASLIVPSASYPTRECKRFDQQTAPTLMRAVLPDLSGSSSSERPIPQAYDARIFTPHTTTNANIVNDATNNALSMEASFITPPSASYPGLNLGDSIVWRQPVAAVFPLWISSTICAARNRDVFRILSSQ